jgi:hypothetical protein
MAEFHPLPTLARSASWPTFVKAAIVQSLEAVGRPLATLGRHWQRVRLWAELPVLISLSICANTAVTPSAIIGKRANAALAKAATVRATSQSMKRLFGISHGLRQASR